MSLILRNRYLPLSLLPPRRERLIFGAGAPACAQIEFLNEGVRERRWQEKQQGQNQKQNRSKYRKIRQNRQHQKQTPVLGNYRVCIGFVNFGAGNFSRGVGMAVFFHNVLYGLFSFGVFLLAPAIVYLSVLASTERRSAQ